MSWDVFPNKIVSAVIRGLLILHTRKEYIIISGFSSIELTADSNQLTTCSLLADLIGSLFSLEILAVCAYMFPRIFSSFVLNCLFMVTSNGRTSDVHPPGITPITVFPLPESFLYTFSQMSTKTVQHN